MNLWAELKRRNVVRVALFYIVAAWLLVQVAETVLPLFDVPAGVMRGLVILLALGFVPAVIVSWDYELTPEGVKRDAEVEVSEQARQGSARKLNLVTLVIALLAIGLLVLEGSVRRAGDALRITAQLIDSGPVLRQQLQFWLGRNILAEADFSGRRRSGRRGVFSATRSRL